jgi:Flp pilus assembly protein TadG
MRPPMRPNFGTMTAATLGRLSRDTAGAVAVELAMMVPFLVLLTVGVIDFGSYMNASQQVAAATRIGAEYARDSTACQQSQTGQTGIDTVNVVINSDCLSGNAQTGAVGIEATMKNSMNLGAALTFPNMTSCNTSPSSCLTCTCDDGSAIACGNTAVCSAATAPKRVFVTVSASLAITPIISWPGFPTTVKGLTQLRLN